MANETSTQMIEQAIESMRKASDSLHKAIAQTEWNAAKEAKTLDAGLLSLLEALVSAQEASDDHFKRFAHENEIAWEKKSMECKQEWSRISEKKRIAEQNILTYARTIVRAKNAA